MRDLRTAAVADATVVVRVDFNVPTGEDGQITDDTRITSALPTINYLSKIGARVLLISHFGRPKGAPDPSLSLAPIAVALEDYFDNEVFFAADCIGEPVERTLRKMKPGDVALLENVRFHAGETSNDPDFARNLAASAQVFVNDAFGACHRKHASVVGLAELMPAYPGFLVEKEVAALQKVLKDPIRPLVAIVGGAKISTKIDVLKKLVGTFDALLLGGGMANTFLAARRLDMANSLVEENLLDAAREIEARTSAHGRDLVLPVDGVMARSLAPDSQAVVHAVDDVPPDWMMLDIGPETVRLFDAHIHRARTIVWNGPMGVFESDAFAEGTKSVARAVASSEAFSVVGGGDSVAAIKMLGIEDAIGHISTGGGASLEMLVGNALPGIVALS